MFKLWGWLRSRLGRGSKRAPIPKVVVEWDLVPFSFATDWCTSASELISSHVEQLEASRRALQKALKDSERFPP